MLRLSAAAKNISMEEEIRKILTAFINRQKCQKGIGSRIARRFADAGGCELQLAERAMPRPAVLLKAVI
ncbi:MAG TPA: plasmid stabilization protein [Candidatus Rifleibacterium sp.]|nr:plasmid stabilization protein [Candidatus Rifleibacterium sp.]HPT47811.1 plasmid stabilization protein [Candidatus Rifleibacterium sp.]